MVQRDAELLRRVATIQRFFGRALELLTAPGFEPFPREVNGSSAYGTRFSRGTMLLYTLVNLASGDDVATINVSAGWAFRDCYRGGELLPSRGVVKTKVEGRGIGCVFAQPLGANLPRGYNRFENATASLALTPLSSFSSNWSPLQQTLIDPGTTTPRAAPEADMVRIPGGSFHFVSRGVEVEGDAEPNGVGEQYPWESHPSRAHDKVLNISAFDISRYPITAAQYSEFLNATGFVPNESTRWLHNWNWTAAPPGAQPHLPSEARKQPVTFVSLAEARGYCAWRGLRLPHSYEWQYAAQSTDSRPYPWGTKSSSVGTKPAPVSGHEDPIPADVDAHPAGASPFGVQDLVGNVWQYTDEFQDAHTRSCVLRGGSRYHIACRPPQFGIGNYRNWYNPQAKTLFEHGKYLLMDDSYERAATIGFRCAADV
mmetsp:Transcript_46293/g.128694  ORF Transcript_46293/g.128694 Transcript_46293/m.128694 type:complete len:427 (-) Transcript_46293:101-1381(-)